MYQQYLHEDISLEDIKEVVSNLTDIDRKELLATSHLRPYTHTYDETKVLETHIKLGVMYGTLTYKIIYNNELLGIIGLRKVANMENNYVIWLVSNNKFHKYSKTFMKECKNFIRDVIIDTKFSVFNYIHKDNVRNIKWLRRLGFTVKTDTVYDFSGEPFYYFYMN